MSKTLSYLEAPSFLATSETSLRSAYVFGKSVAFARHRNDIDASHGVTIVLEPLRDITFA